ncbi:MAG: hypothetical protein HC866_12090 [Leptolyngbyaceae cyanobacterium RU_5_1]|nr:hypothetical protein [Leptolyngbyaceae cyanobacterium RU_5_1]
MLYTAPTLFHSSATIGSDQGSGTPNRVRGETDPDTLPPDLQGLSPGYY